MSKTLTSLSSDHILSRLLIVIVYKSFSLEPSEMKVYPESPLQVALDPDSSPPTKKTLEGMYSLPLPITVSFMNLSNKKVQDN